MMRRKDVEFDPAKAAANLRKHGVSFAHAELAPRDPQAVTIDDRMPSPSAVSSRSAWMRWVACSWWSTSRAMDGRA